MHKLRSTGIKRIVSSRNGTFPVIRKPGKHVTLRANETAIVFVSNGNNTLVYQYVCRPVPFLYKTRIGSLINITQRVNIIVHYDIITCIIHWLERIM